MILLLLGCKADASAVRWDKVDSPKPGPIIFFVNFTLLPFINDYSVLCVIVPTSLKGKRIS